MSKYHWGLWLLLSPLSFALSAQTIAVYQLSSAPTLDGDSADWASIPATTVALTPLLSDGVVKARQVTIKAGYHDEEIFFYLEWADDEKDSLHKPYAWDQQKKRYVRGPQREDRLALQFRISGDYTADWRRGQHFTADMWHWKASRSNPIGLVHDKVSSVSSERLLRASKIEGDNGAVYVLRNSDAGDALYSTRRYSKNVGALMPKYHLNETAKGSIADIQAKGVWAAGRWHLELRRKLNTGHDDDAVFRPGSVIQGAIAIFDGSENEDHNVSDTLLFQL